MTELLPILLIILAAFIAARRGVTAGLLAGAFVMLVALITVQLVTAAAITATAFVVAVLAGRLREKLERVRGVHRIVHAEVVDTDQRLSSILESITDGFVTLDESWRLTYVNRSAERILARPRQKLIGRSALEVFPEGVGSRIHRELEKARNEHRPAEFEAWYEPARRWFEIRAFPADDGTLTVYFRDITRQKDVQESLAREATARQAEQHVQRLLANAGSALAATLNYEQTVATVVEFVVPQLADCCILDVAEPAAGDRRIEIAWAEEANGEQARITRRVESAQPSGAQLVPDDTAVLITDVSDETLQQLAGDAADLERLRSAHVRSVIVVPLHVGGRTLGTLSALAVNRSFTDADFQLITELARRAAFAIDNAVLYETATMANQSKSDFLAVMSHELRTPLTTVMGYTDLLLAGVPTPLSPQSQTYVERIRTAAWHLLGLIEQILIYARLEVGRERVHVEKVPVDRVLRDAAELIEPVASEKGLQFFLIDPPKDVLIETDVTKLRQILLNLLSNAVKFTETGSVMLEAQVGETSVRFMVHDTGIGIAPDHQHRVFESFWQVDQSATRKEGGTGIGLSVSRKLARLLGGDITVRSEPEQGTTFTLTLPRAGLTAATVRT